MQSTDIPKVIGLLAGTLCLIGFIVWNVLRSDRLEQRLIEELEDVAELDNEMCPFDGALTQTSTVLLFDFSDPLPAELSDYPDALLENMLAGLQEAERFDRFGLYTLNPYGNVPSRIATFCVPVTMSQIPLDVRQALWGNDPTENVDLPTRYERFRAVFEPLWENERELRKSVEEARRILDEPRPPEQEFSRIAENIEWISALEIDRNPGRVNIVVLSDMLQNSPTYSHYRNRWGFDDYLTTRSSDLQSMRRIEFSVHLVQSCQSISTDRRRALRQFWEDYFEKSGASVQFRPLGIDGSICGSVDSGASTDSRQPSAPEALTVNEIVPMGPPVGDRPLPDPNPTGSSDPELPAAIGAPLVASSATVGGTEIRIEFQTADGSAVALPSGEPVVAAANGGDNAESAPSLVDCPNPVARTLPNLSYPRNARGTAVLRYMIEVDDRGIPVALDLYDLEIAVPQHEQRFVEAADTYVRSLRFDVQANDDCSGGRTARFALRYE